MRESDLKNSFDLIQLGANDFLHCFGPEFTNTSEGHIATDIAGASCVAGLSILRSIVTNLSEIDPGTVILAEVHDDQNKVLNFITGVALTMGLDLRPTIWNRLKTWLKMKDETVIPNKFEPLYTALELGQKLESKLYDVCAKIGLGNEFAPFIAILSSAKLVSAGLEMGILNLRVGKELLFYFFIAGSKIVPYPIK